MQTLTQIKELLAARGLAPRKSFGQNFLVDHNLIKKLVDTAAVAPGDLVLEIGPGTGALTEELLARGCSVIAIELDRGLAALLRERSWVPRLSEPTGVGPLSERTLGPLGRPDTSEQEIGSESRPTQGAFTLIEGDALASKRHLNKEAVAALAGRPFKLIANLPYGAATPVMLALLIEHPECRGQFVTIQREVADRLLAGPGSKDYGTISVIAQALCTVTRIAILSPECFWPRPEVTSAMISLTPLPEPLTDNPARLAETTQTIFSQRRKQLGSILGRDRPGGWPAGIRPDQRAEELSVEQIVALAAGAGTL